MMLIWVYIVLAVIVGVAANSRGRSGIGWFFLALIISPFISGLLVLALRRVDRGAIEFEKRDRLLAKSVNLLPSPLRQEGPFEADGVFKGVPYKIREKGMVEAMMPSGMVRFRSIEHFQAAAEGRDPQLTVSDSMQENIATIDTRTAILRIFRGGGNTNRFRKYKILVNGIEIGAIAHNSAADFQVPCGTLKLTAQIDWCRSQPVLVEAQPNERIEIEVSNTRGPLLGIWSVTFGSGSYLTLKRVRSP